MRLLLVEDEMRMAQALREILRLENYDVDHCENGSDGLCALETGTYDLAPFWTSCSREKTDLRSPARRGNRASERRS